MLRIKRTYCILVFFILMSLAAKLALIFKYKNLLTLSSDDINYVKSAVALLKNHILTYHSYNEPTVFIMPAYPFFLALIFKVFGYGIAGFQAVRVIQAFISCLTILFVFLVGRQLFDSRVGLISAFLVSFYVPNIVTTGYFLTETLFTMVLCALIYFSLKAGYDPRSYRFVLLGALWAAATLCRPTIALYPIFLFLYFFLYHRMNILMILKTGFIMIIIFTIIMAPWWVRNYMEYGEFIPLAASSGNPMLQGTYVNYKQTPENIVYYKMGKNAFETNKNEMEAAKQRIKTEINNNFWRYLKWYTIEKTLLLWEAAFYWKVFFNISYSFVLAFHYFLLIGFVEIIMLIAKSIYNRMNRRNMKEKREENLLKYLLPVCIIIYFNLIHCVYMAFDRYAFPMMPLLSVFTGFLTVRVYELSKRFILCEMPNNIKRLLYVSSKKP